jgi:hypothetical protein
VVMSNPKVRRACLGSHESVVTYCGQRRSTTIMTTNVLALILHSPQQQAAVHAFQYVLKKSTSLLLNRSKTAEHPRQPPSDVSYEVLIIVKQRSGIM